MGKLGTNEVSAKIGEAEIRLESGGFAEQAGGACIAHLGETSLHVTTTASARPKEHLDFLPLTVDYEERQYAAGKVPGGFFKREGRPTENAILTARLIDRPMRPSFDDGLRNEIQILLLTLSADQLHTPDVLAINGASMATLLSGIPFDGPVAGLRMAMDRAGEWHPFPTFGFLDNEAVFDLVVSGRLNQDTGEIDLLMVEAQATPHAVEAIEGGATKPSEEQIAGALEEAKRHLRAVCDLQLELVEQVGQREGEYPLYPAYHPTVYEVAERTASDQLRAVLIDEGLSKAERNDKLTELRESTVDQVFQDAGELEVSDEELERQAKNAFRSLEKTLIRRRIVDDGVRIDGRGPAEIRPLEVQVDLVPRVHGSGMFRRGETQVLNLLTLGMLRESQRLDTIDPATEKRYIHHYNFLPFSTGETGFMRGPKRRELGHGALAERAVLPVVPGPTDFPYTLRLVSEVLSSNGSTSMASVCASTLALMDGGVPISAPVAGIAMGLVSEGGKHATLTDIQGAEDAFGDMDFKVAGTADFITALQLDTKVAVSADVLRGALGQAKDARDQVLAAMTDVMPRPRTDMKPTAPRVFVEYIPGDKIGEVIGPKGKIIREITEATGADVDIEEADGRGVVHVYSSDSAAAERALEQVRAIANPVVPKEGERYYGTIVKTADFGAFVSLTPGSDGLLHISKLGGQRRLDHADEAVQVGDKVWVEVAQVKEGNKFALDLVEEALESAAASGVTPPAAEAAPAEATPAQPAPAEPAASPPSPGGQTAGEAPEQPRERSRSRSGQAEDSGGEQSGERRSRRRGGDTGGEEEDEGKRRRRRRRS